MPKAKDYTGSKFGRLEVLERTRRYENGRYKTYYKCRCECGKTIETRADGLVRGTTVSCGCYHLEVTGNINRGKPTATLTHGKAQTRLYRVFRDMKNRCYNKNSKDYKNYGGRGITICKEWLEDYMNFDRWAFANGYDPDAPKMQCTIDRIDNDKGYSPDNCRWVDIATQNRNRRARSAK